MKMPETADEIEWFEERAGILEFDGGMPRKTAEARALIEWREYWVPVEYEK